MSYRLPFRCPKCKELTPWLPKKMIDSAGRERYPFICTSCGYMTGFCEKKDKVLDIIKRDQSPIISEQKKGNCEKCGEYTYLEKHHWAPRKLFKEADEWPTSMLCRSCHKIWHKIVTNDIL